MLISVEMTVVLSGFLLLGKLWLFLHKGTGPLFISRAMFLGEYLVHIS